MKHLNEFDKGFLLGLLVGEGCFGGDSKQAAIVVRMHIHHKRVFDWLVEKVPGGKLYGPYCHDNRNYYHWTVRGRYLREEMIPFLNENLTENLSQRVFDRFQRMKEKYSL